MAGWEGEDMVPEEVEGPERHDGEDLDLAELHRGPTEDMIWWRERSAGMLCEVGALAVFALPIILLIVT